VIPPGEAKPAGAARRALLRAAAGYPMVLELLVQDWQAHGEQSLALSLGAMTTELAQRTDAGAYDQLFARINRGLDPVTQTVLNLAAILGRRLNDVEMYSLLDLGLGHTVSGLAQLTNLRVLRDGSRGLEFVNELIRACAYQAVPSPIRRELHSRIADRLLARGPEATSQCGLEIAWHCIRSARLEEAVPYLLAGASEAIRSGAPHEAERALTTGSAQFTGDRRARAATLLAEALQEQGGWAASLRVIEESLPTVQGSDAELLRILEVIARHRCEALTSLAATERVVQLWRMIETSGDPANRVKAVSAAAMLAGSLRNAHAAKRTDHLAREIPCLNLHQKLDLSCARSILAYHYGDRAASLVHLKEAWGLVKGREFANSTAARIHTLLGVHAVLDGHYEEAVRHHMAAYQVAKGLGNDEIIANSCSNLAVCHGRLGDARAQVEWADRGTTLLPPVFGGYWELQLTYWKALGHASLRQPAEATAAMSFVDARLPDDFARPTVRLWLLMKADVLTFLGKDVEAKEFARQATTYDGAITPLPNLEGFFARWAAVLAATWEENLAVSVVARSLGERLASLAALDQAEVLAAAAMVGRRLGHDVTTESERLHRTLLEMPPAVAVHLRRVGAVV